MAIYTVVCLAVVVHWEDMVLSSGKRLSSGDLALLSSQLAAVAERGIPLHQGLRAVASDARPGALRDTCDSLAEDLESGKQLSSAVADCDGQFPDLWPGMLDVGETSGRLVDTLRDLSEYHVVMLKLRFRAIEAMAYPLVLMVFYAVLLLLMLQFLVPCYGAMDREFGMELPGLTRLLIRLRIWYCPSLLVLAASGVAFALLTKAVGRPGTLALVAERLVLISPARRVHKSAALCRFCRSLGLLLGQGLGLPTAVATARGCAGSRVVSRAASDVLRQVESGGRLSAGLRQHRVFPRMLVDMVEAAEQRGDLPSTLANAAQSFRAEAQDSTSALSSLLPGLGLCLIAAIYVFTVIALFQPLIYFMGH